MEGKLIANKFSYSMGRDITVKMTKKKRASSASNSDLFYKTHVCRGPFLGAKAPLQIAPVSKSVCESVTEKF